MLEVKCLVQRTTFEGEAVAFELKGSMQQVLEGIQSCFDTCDKRIRNMNERSLKARNLLLQLDEEERNKLWYLMDVLHGVATPEAAANRLNIDAEDKTLRQEPLESIATNGYEG